MVSSLDWLDDESLTRDALLAELENTVRTTFLHVCSLDCGCALLRFLVARANTQFTVEDIAYHLHESCGVVECNLLSLVDLRLARQVHVVGLTLFGLTTDPEMKRLVHELCGWQDRWHARLLKVERAIYVKTGHLEA